MPFHDNWWQTETGGIMIANYASMDVKPGSMGKPLPGNTAGVVAKSNGGVTAVDDPMVIGELALKPGDTWVREIKFFAFHARGEIA